MAAEPNQPVFESIFQQYERVVVQSLITSFGLDAFISDRHGGDVDTIHNVRQIGKDTEMTYKNASNAKAYEQRGEYNSHEYHSHPGYIYMNREASKGKKAGTLNDAYTGKPLGPHDKTNLDHTISAKEIHDDPGRVLAGLAGEDLANSPENLNVTNEHTNKSKKADSMEDFLAKHGDEYTEEQKKRMRQKDKKAREAYERKLAQAYYTSPAFFKDTALAAGQVGVQMGLRQALGLVFSEIWFSVREQFVGLKTGFMLEDCFSRIAGGIKRGIERAREKYRDILTKFKEGMLSGALSSISTTLCNIFFTTAKNVVKIIRQTWASIVEAIKILIFNPDRFPLGERIRAAAKVLSVGASVVVGDIVMELVNNSPVGKLPAVGGVVSAFCGALVSGIMSCTLLYVLDRSKYVQNIVEFLNNFNTMDTMVDFYQRAAEMLEEYAARLEALDIAAFRRETEKYHVIAMNLDKNATLEEMSRTLHAMYAQYRLPLPWQGNFDNFMADNSNRLIFS